MEIPRNCRFNACSSLLLSVPGFSSLGNKRTWYHFFLYSLYKRETSQIFSVFEFLGIQSFVNTSCFPTNPSPQQDSKNPRTDIHIF